MVGRTKARTPAFASALAQRATHEGAALLHLDRDSTDAVQRAPARTGYEDLIAAARTGHESERAADPGGEARNDRVIRAAARVGTSGASRALPHLAAIQKSFGRHDVSHVSAHTDDAALAGAEAMGARAFAVGEHIAFAGLPDLHTVAHEATHVIQQRAGVHLDGGVGNVGDPYERHADAVAERVVAGESTEALLDHPPGIGMAQPATKSTATSVTTAPSDASIAQPIQRNVAKGAVGVATRLLRWLEVRGAKKFISKHVAKHGRRIAGKSVHTIYKNPRKIRILVNKAAQEALQLAETNVGKQAHEALSGPGIRMFRQAAGPGKFRWVIEKEFKSAIGKGGERLLKLVVDASGRIVTAYPIEQFSALGLGAAAMIIFDTKAAEAGEHIHSAVEGDARRRENEEDSWSSFFIDLVTPLGFEAGTLNEGEDLDLEIWRNLDKAHREIVTEIENEQKRTLSEAERGELRDLLEASVGTSMLSTDLDADEESDE